MLKKNIYMSLGLAVHDSSRFAVFKCLRTQIPFNVWRRRKRQRLQYCRIRHVKQHNWADMFRCASAHTAIRNHQAGHCLAKDLISWDPYARADKFLAKEESRLSIRTTDAFCVKWTSRFSDLQKILTDVYGNNKKLLIKIVVKMFTLFFC